MTDNSKQSVEERKQFILDFVKDNPLEPNGAALSAALLLKYPDITSGGHRGMVGRLFNGTRPWEIDKACPNVARGTCNAVVTTMEEGLALFGHRCKKQQLQSYCKKCRNRARREARVVRNAKAEAKKTANNTNNTQ